MKVFVLKIVDDEGEVAIHLFGKWDSVVKRVLEEEGAKGGAFAKKIKTSLNETRRWVNEVTFYEYEVSVRGLED